VDLPQVARPEQDQTVSTHDRWPGVADSPCSRQPIGWVVARWQGQGFTGTCT